MSAASPRILDKALQDKAAEKAHEPSMEEILASIRRIIADDQAAKPNDPASARSAAVDDILDLAEVAEPVARPASPISVVRPPAPEPAPQPAPLDFDEIDFQDAEAVFDPPAPAERPAAQAAPQPAPQPARRPEPGDEPLISTATDASVGNAFHLLAHTVMSQNARTLEDLVKDMLRPMLKAWLDDNLPVVVERLVRAEIERVSRGR